MMPHWVKTFFYDQKHWEELTFFRGVSLFHDLRSRDMGRIMQAVQKRTYRAGEVLFSEGQVGKAVFIIRSGRVKLVRATSSGERTLGFLSPGQLFGEMALLENLPRTASAVMVEEGDIYLLYTSALEELSKSSPTIGAALMRNMAIMLSGLLRKSNLEIDKQGPSA
jgi:CRP-like cAMP-binding protein